jgi:hypothetical protein
MWFIVKDATAGQQVLIDAPDAGAATREYLEEYPPDLMVEPASDQTVENWDSDPSDPLPY